VEQDSDIRSGWWQPVKPNTIIDHDLQCDNFVKWKESPDAAKWTAYFLLDAFEKAVLSHLVYISAVMIMLKYHLV
jgi:hypothetical protein